MLEVREIVACEVEYIVFEAILLEESPVEGGREDDGRLFGAAVEEMTGDPEVLADDLLGMDDEDGVAAIDKVDVAFGEVTDEKLITGREDVIDEFEAVTTIVDEILGEDSDSGEADEETADDEDLDEAEDIGNEETVDDEEVGIDGDIIVADDEATAVLDEPDLTVVDEGDTALIDEDRAVADEEDAAEAVEEDVLANEALGLRLQADLSLIALILCQLPLRSVQL
ncbi:hypothetical protein ACLMJK_001170 [Lecanora helva]